MLFVTKCPCDECVPLIRGAGITHIYTTDQDRDKDKVDISYLRFSSLKNVSKFIVSTWSDVSLGFPHRGESDTFLSSQWQRTPAASSPSSPLHASKLHPPSSRLQTCLCAVSRCNPCLFVADGCFGKHSRQADQENHSNKKLCTNRSHDSPTVS